MRCTSLKRCCSIFLVVSGLAAGPAAVAQGPSQQDARILTELEDLSSHATTVFVGHLQGIDRQGAVVQVRFRVEQPVRGDVGATVVLREWAGNWAPGQTRYVVGSRVLAFLHGSSAAGLSSPVHGSEGLVPVVVQGANEPELVDIRRIAASVVRAPGTPLPTAADGALPLNDVLRAIAGDGHRASLGRVPIPTQGRLPVDLLPVSGPVRTSEGGTMRPVNGPGPGPVQRGISDAHR